MIAETSIKKVTRLAKIIIIAAFRLNQKNQKIRKRCVLGGRWIFGNTQINLEPGEKKGKNVE